MAVTMTLLSTLILMPLYIKLARKFKVGQLIKEDGPDLHGYKMGTPTMGGIVFVSVSIAFLLLSRSDPVYPLSLFLFGLVGAMDDVSSFLKRDAYGMRARTKFALQVLLSIPIVLAIGKETLLVPGMGELSLGWAYKAFAVFLITGASNAVNLTDGLDGLAGFVSLSAFVPMFAVTALRGNPDPSILVVSAAIGGFLIYNIKPAKVFMGDVGSLAIGAFMATYAMRNDLEIPLILFGFVFVVETLSVMIQVSSYKIRGKRVFRMAPVHHHFELLGWSEERIVFLFTAINSISSIIALGWSV